MAHIAADHAEWPAPGTETDAERAARLEWERAMIEEAREDVRAGRVIPDGEVDAWLDRLVRGEPLTFPGDTRIAPRHD